ncbi:MAG: hypothetical protein HY827_06940 [Actinobacteria bacterium]|nr:hypothetical protein [Actinomycetota bacterium]
MALELKKCRVLDGATRKEVENLLGRPPDWQSDDNWREVDLWYFTVGPIDGVFGPKSSGNEELVVAFGTDDRVTDLYFENTE